MLLCLESCLFANRSSSNACIMVLPKLTFVFFELHSFINCHVGDDWRYTCYGFWCETRVSAELAGALLTLFFAWNVNQHVWRATVQLTGNVARSHSQVTQWSSPRGPNADMPRTRPESNCVNKNQPREYFYSSARTLQGLTCTQACWTQQPTPHCS